MNKKKGYGVFFLFLILSSINFSLLALPSFAITQEEDISIEYGDNVFQNLAYTYSGTFYDDSDITFAYSDADIEFTYIPDATVNNEYPITGWEGEYRGTESFNYTTEEGVYYGTYDFRDDTVGGNPAGWTITEETDCSARVIASLDGHEQVLAIIDNHAVNDVQLADSFTMTTDGTIEFYWRFTATHGTQQYLELRTKEGSSIRIRMYFNYGALGRISQRDAGGFDTICTGVVDTWYHIKIICDDTANTFEFFFDHVSMGSFPYYYNSTVGMDNIWISTRPDSAIIPFTHWLDAIGYSFDSTSHSGLGYTVGYNINPYDIEPLLEANYEMVIKYDSYVRILNEFEGHNNVLDVYDDTGSGSPFVSVYFTSTPDPIVEFWAYTNNTSYSQFSIQNMGSFCFHDNKLKHYDGGWNILVDPVPINNWQLLKFVGDSDANLVDIYVNGTLEVDDLAMSVGSTAYVQFAHSTGSTQISLYIDALGIDGVNDYDVGDNYKTELNYIHTLTLLGTWKYRFKLDEGKASEYIQDWVYFNLIEQKANFEGISESSYTTKWQLTSSSQSSSFEQKYQDLMGSNFWALTGTSEDVIYYSENPEDAYVDNYYAGTNYGATTDLDIYHNDDDRGWNYVIPNGNSAPNDWHSDYSAANHWMAIDEYLTLDGNENWADSTDDGQLEEYSMSTFTMAVGSSVGTITAVDLYVYTSSNAGLYDDYTGSMRVYIGGWTSSQDLVFDWITGGVWVNYEWAGLSKTQADLDGMLVELTAPATIDGSENNRVWSVYVKVSYELDFNRHRKTLVGSEIPYLLDNITANSEFRMKTYTGGDYASTVNISTTTAFTEGTVTWNTKPVAVSYLDDEVVNADNTWYSFDLGSAITSNNYYILETNDIVTDNGAVIYSSEHETPANRPLFNHYISKVYQNLASNYAYMQTNESETLGLRSQALGTDVSLSSDNSDYFGLYIQSNTQTAYLKLYNNGVLQDTLTILENNVLTTVQYVEVSIDSDVSFDQVEISSLLNEEEYVKLFNITAKGFTFEAQELTTTFYIDPDGAKQVPIATIGDADLKIYDNGILRYEATVTLTTELSTVIYVREVESIINLNYFDPDGVYLIFNSFKTYVNYTLDDILYSDKRLASNFLYVDSGSTIDVIIYDSFENPIISNSYPEQKFLDIELDIYELKIKNERLNPVSYSLENIDISTSKTGSLFENEILTLLIASGEYSFDYLEFGEIKWKEFNFTLNDNQYFVLNRSQICFLSYTNQRGEFLDFNQFKTYWNGTLLYENIFYEDIGKSAFLEIRDHYDISVKNHSFIVDSGNNYIPVVLTTYSLKIFNQQEEFNHINITRDPNYYESGYSWSEYVAPSEIIEFDLFTGYYKINLTDEENGSYSYYSYTLNGDDILLITSGYTISSAISNILNVNTTIGNQITNVEINLSNQNSEINNTIVNVNINLDNVNSTLNNLLISQNLQLTNIQNNISNLFVFMDNNFTSLQNNINFSFVDLTNDVYLINNSIYTAVANVEANLHLINNTINGNLTLILQQNDFLTAILQETMFSNLLNWTDAGYNISFISDQVDAWDFINNFRNESILIKLRYEGIIENLTLAAQESLTQYLPSDDVDYRLWSIADEEYLSDWEPLPENRTVDFGFYDEELSKGPDFYAPNTILMIILIVIACIFPIAIIGYIANRYRKKSELYRKSYADKITLEAETISKFSQGRRIK